MNKLTLALISGVVFIAIVATIVFLVLRGTPEADDDPTPPPSHAPVETHTPEPTETSRAADPDADEEAAVAAAEDFVRAMYDQSYKDDSPNTWYYATEEFTTEKYYRTLTDGIDPDDGGSMSGEMAAEKLSIHANIKHTEVIKDSADTCRVYVQFSQVTDKAGGDNTYSTGGYTVAKVIRSGQKWLVDDSGESEELMKDFFADGTDEA